MGRMGPNGARPETGRKEKDPLGKIIASRIYRRLL